MANIISVSDVIKARNSWIKAVESLDVAATVNLYDPQQGRLLGTLDISKTEKRDTVEKIRDYFNHFLSNDKVVADFPKEIQESDIQQLGHGYVAYNGYYKFTLTKDGITNIANAKFTYIYRKEVQGKLLIVTHNSGLTPEGIVKE